MEETSLAPKLSATKCIVGILGTGDFGRALGARLVTAGYPVIFGSQDPANRIQFLAEVKPILRGVPVVTIPECVSKCSILIPAISAENHNVLISHSEALLGKIIVDVSNPSQDSTNKSQAERLQTMLPKVRVVKAFNTVSAYSLGETTAAGGSRVVYICGEDPQARDQVHVMAVNMGLEVLDMGGLVAARGLERSMQTVLPGWGWPLIVTGLWLIFWTIYSICRYYVLRKDNPYTWERLPTNVMNKVAGCMGITLLALCYLPGCLVAITQLARGTKYQALPKWMDAWLKMRKQLGLYGLFFALLHLVMSMCLLTPAYFSKWFLRSSVTVPGNSTQDVVVSLSSRMSWMGETTILLAVLSTALFCILGISSLPSVSQHLNWKEWNFVQTYLGLLCLLLACAHVTVKAAPDWVSMTFIDIFQGLSFLSQVIPYIVLACRIILWIPCINNKLWNIRSGQVKNTTTITTSTANTGNGYVKQVSNGNVNPGFVNVDITEM